MSKSPTALARAEANKVMDAMPKHPAFPLASWRLSDSGRAHHDAIEAALLSAYQRGLEDAMGIVHKHVDAMVASSNELMATIRALSGPAGQGE